MSKQIPLTQGKSAIVDDADYEWLSKMKWCARKRDDGLGWYACRKERINGRQHQQQMHRLILDISGDLKCDHRDGNGLNNQRKNLRVATNKQNSRNQRAQANTKTGLKGVTVCSTTGKYQSQIRVDGALIYLGTFENKIDAAKSYNVAALKYFGEFAYLNDLSQTGVQ